MKVTATVSEDLLQQHCVLMAVDFKTWQKAFMHCIQWMHRQKSPILSLTKAVREG